MYLKQILKWLIVIFATIICLAAGLAAFHNKVTNYILVKNTPFKTIVYSITAISKDTLTLEDIKLSDDINTVYIPKILIGYKFTDFKFSSTDLSAAEIVISQKNSRKELRIENLVTNIISIPNNQLQILLRFDSLVQKDTNIRNFKFEGVAQKQQMLITSASAQAFDGEFNLSNHLVKFDQRPISFPLGVSNFDLNKFLSKLNYPHLEVHGTLNGILPVILDKNGNIVIDEGSLISTDGLILFDYPLGEINDKKTRITYQALNGLSFDDMHLQVILEEDGKLIIKATIKGKNPKFFEKRPIHLNVIIEENLPQLLKTKSLFSLESLFEQRGPNE